VALLLGRHEVLVVGRLRAVRVCLVWWWVCWGIGHVRERLSVCLLVAKRRTGDAHVDFEAQAEEDDAVMGGMEREW